MGTKQSCLNIYVVINSTTLIKVSRAGVTSRGVPHRYVSPHTPAMLCASHTLSTSHWDCAPTSFFRVMKRRSIGFRVQAELQNSRRISIAIHVMRNLYALPH